MKKILVRYWKTTYYTLPYKDREEFDFSHEKRNEIVDTCISNGYSVMLRPTESKGENILIIYIDKGRFGQS